MKPFKLILIVCLFSMFTSCKKERYSDSEQDERQKVIDDYNTVMLPNEVYTFSADNEDQGPCNAGTIEIGKYKNIENSLNYFRKLVGCSPIEIDSSYNKQCQAYLLVALANKDIKTLTPSAKCYSSEANEAWGTVISSSKFYTNANGPITHFINEEKYVDAIKDVINRRWLLYPKLQKTGYAHYKTYFGVKVIGNNTINTAISSPEYVAWPPSGFIMDAIMPKTWSFTMLNADFTNASVTLKTRDFSKSQNKAITKLPMVNVNLTVLNAPLTTHGDDFTILWNFTPPKVDDKYEDEDLEYEVTINNVKVAGETKSYTYKVKSIKKK